MGSKAMALTGQSCLTPLVMRNFPLVRSCKFHVSSTVAVNHPQNSTSELGQLCLLEHMEKSRND